MSTMSQILRYQKEDKYGNHIFIASGKNDDEQDSYRQLEKLAGKIEDFNYGTFSPIYHNDEICTIRFKFLKSKILSERNLYKVDYVIKKSTHNDQHYVNCFVNTIKLAKKATPREDGETIDFGL